MQKLSQKMDYIEKIKILSLLLVFLTFQQCGEKLPVENCIEYDTYKFVGNYNVNENCQQGFGGVVFANIVEGNSTAANHITFLNFRNTGIPIDAYISCTEQNTSGNTSIYFRIPDQTFGTTASSVAGEGYYVEAAGYTQLQFDVSIVQNGQANYCSYTYSK